MTTEFFRPSQSNNDTSNDEPDLPEIKDLGALCSPEIQSQALEARATILKLIDDLPTASPRFRQERARIVSERIATVYLPAVQAIRDATTPDQIESLRVTLEDRLEAGESKPATPKRDALWIRLLGEYEVCIDALSENCMARYQDRLADIEARWA